MTLDELELVGRLGEVEPLSDEVHSRARAALQGAIGLETTPGLTPMRRGRRQRRRRGALMHGALGATIAAAAAVVTVVATTSSNPSPPAPGNAQAVAPLMPAPNLRLVRLADKLTTEAAPLAGNATLVIRRTSYPDGGGMTGADLYTDGGAYYYADAPSGLPAQIAAGADEGDGMFGREVAAALAAANGDVTAARTQMAYAPLGHVPTAAQMQDAAAEQRAHAQKLGRGKLTLATPTPRKSAVLPATSFDNYVWMDSVDALSAAGGNLKVRIGVLRILATLPEVTVTNGTTGGRPTLTLTAKAPALPDDYQEALTVDAASGIPVAFAGGNSGQTPSVTISYDVSRVTLADVAAGRF